MIKREEITDEVTGKMAMISAVRSISSAYLRLMINSPETKIRDMMDVNKTETMEVPHFFAMIWKEVLNELKETAVDVFKKYNHKTSEEELSSCAEDSLFEFRSTLLMGFLNEMNKRRKEIESLLENDPALKPINDQIRKHGIESFTTGDK